jgi:hypothetical protein
MTDIERRIRIEQEWARRNVIAEHLNGQRYEAYNWRRGLREPNWELGDLSWSVPHWKEPTREFEFKLNWESLSTSSHGSQQQRPPIAWIRATAIPACWLLVRWLSRRMARFIHNL